MHKPVEFQVVAAKLSGLFRQCGTIKLSAEAPRVLRAAFESDQLI